MAPTTAVNGRRPLVDNWRIVSMRFYTHLEKRRLLGLPSATSESDVNLAFLSRARAGTFFQSAAQWRDLQRRLRIHGYSDDLTVLRHQQQEDEATTTTSFTTTIDTRTSKKRNAVMDWYDNDHQELNNNNTGAHNDDDDKNKNKNKNKKARPRPRPIGKRPRITAGGGAAEMKEESPPEKNATLGAHPTSTASVNPNLETVLNVHTGTSTSAARRKEDPPGSMAVVISPQHHTTDELTTWGNLCTASDHATHGSSEPNKARVQFALAINSALRDYQHASFSHDATLQDCSSCADLGTSPTGRRSNLPKFSFRNAPQSNAATTATTQDNGSPWYRQDPSEEELSILQNSHKRNFKHIVSISALAVLCFISFHALLWLLLGMDHPGLWSSMVLEDHEPYKNHPLRMCWSMETIGQGEGASFSSPGMTRMMLSNHNHGIALHRLCTPWSGGVTSLILILTLEVLLLLLASMWIVSKVLLKKTMVV